MDKRTDTDGYLGFSENLVREMSNLANMDIIIGDALNLPFENELFDAVLCIEVIEHIEEDKRAMAEISRVMKPEGVGVFTTPNGLVVENINPHHIRHYTPSEFEDKLKTYFNTSQVFTICPWAQFHQLLHRLLREFRLPHLLLYSFLRVFYLSLNTIMSKKIGDQGAVIVALVSEPRVSKH